MRAAKQVLLKDKMMILKWAEGNSLDATILTALRESFRYQSLGAGVYD